MPTRNILPKKAIIPQCTKVSALKDDKKIKKHPIQVLLENIINCSDVTQVFD